MSIKQNGGVFGRNPTFNDVTIEGQLTFDGDIDINSDLKIDGNLDVTGTATMDGLVVDGGNSGTNVDIASFTSASGALNIRCSDLSAGNPTWTLRTFSGEPIAFGQGTDERMRISASGSVGIGTSLPSGKLSIEGNTASSEASHVTFTNTQGAKKFAVGGGQSGVTNNGFVIRNVTDNTFPLVISDAGASVFASTIALKNTLSISSASTSGFLQASSNVLQFGTSSDDRVDFFANNDVRLSLATNGAATFSSSVTATGYFDSSDERLKENIADADDSGNKVDAIQVRKFDWKADGEHQDYGMIAQELQAVAPEAVLVPEDSDEMMGVDYSKLVPMLIKEIQSLRQRVASLEE